MTLCTYGPASDNSLWAGMGAGMAGELAFSIQLHHHALFGLYINNYTHMPFRLQLANGELAQLVSQ